MLPKGSQLKLVVSTGPAAVTMPSVVGLQRAQAETLLNQVLGLGVQINLVNAGPTKKGIVISQNPPPNTQVQKGSSVQIIVGA
jgi:serine/threonine-protein kinase